MEIIAELLIGLLQIVAEIVLQIVVEALLELGLHSVREPFRRKEPINPWLAGIGYAMLGAIMGGVSIWLLPELFIAAPWARVANLLLTPIAAGAAMAAMGAWRRKRDEEVIRLDRFAYGFLFAFAMAVVRFTWGH